MQNPSSVSESAATPTVPPLLAASAILRDHPTPAPLCQELDAPYGLVQASFQRLCVFMDYTESEDPAMRKALAAELVGFIAVTPLVGSVITCGYYLRPATPQNV